MEQKKVQEIVIDHTNFIFKTNFAGDPERNGKFGGTDRRCNIVIPTQELANEIAAIGLEVKQYVSVDQDTGETKTTLFLPAKLAYRNKDGSLKYKQPSVHVVYNNGKPQAKDEDTVGSIDKERVLDVRVTVRPWYYDVTGKWYAYINVLYVVCDANEDPFAADYYGSNIAPDEEYLEEED